jgi:pimeloyl-ACP methyl ester carboxylesterase
LDKQARDSVTSENPLELELDVSLGEGEHLLPVAYDPELKLYLPLGLGEAKNGKTEVRLERLPEPISEGERSLLGSIKIFFHKVVSSVIGIDFPYPLLRIAAVDDDGKVVYSNGDPKVVKAKVDEAKKVVLYVHGIIGDTLSMAASARPGLLKLSKKLLDVSQGKDTVLLTFDYENLNTAIEATAEKLELRLAEVGLTPGHGKKLTIVAHSMGGLVSRWFIEKLTGNQVASQLVMLGTPNKGSPWPKIQDLLTLGITIGINGLATVTWPLSILGGLVGALEKIDTALDQMKADGDFLKTLNGGAAPNPKIPYTIIAGNTSLQPSSYKKLVNKLTQTAANAVFFKQPNDIAVGVSSVHGVQDDRASKMTKLEVGCDHMSYFFTLEGLEELTKALA